MLTREGRALFLFCKRPLFQVQGGAAEPESPPSLPPSHLLPFQTCPVYLARLIMQMPQNKSTRFVESVVFALYNYASNAREAFLLLRLFRSALQEEIE